LDLNFEPADHNVWRGPTIIGRKRFTSLASMVLPLNVYRRSLVRPNNPQKLSPSRKARSARTPPSTFLFLPIQLSNSPGSKAPLSY